MIACMGGWCRQREGCAHYHSTSKHMVERLCPKGKDEPEPIRIVRKHEPAEAHS